MFDERCELLTERGGVLTRNSCFLEPMKETALWCQALRRGRE
jgi:hypothetical protein